MTDMDDQQKDDFLQLGDMLGSSNGDTLSPLGQPLGSSGGSLTSGQAALLGSLPPQQLQLLMAVMQQQQPQQSQLQSRDSLGAPLGTSTCGFINRPNSGELPLGGGLQSAPSANLAAMDLRSSGGSSSSSSSLNSSFGGFGSFNNSFGTPLSPNGGYGMQPLLQQQQSQQQQQQQHMQTLLQQQQSQQQQQQHQQHMQPLLSQGSGGVAAAAAALPPLAPTHSGGLSVNDVGNGMHLPAEARDTIYIEDLPGDVTKRELAQIFRPFPGYETVRLHVKDSVKHPGEKVNLAFVHFSNAYHATVALNALQHYRLDLDKGENSPMLRLKYAVRHSRRHNVPPGL